MKFIHYINVLVYTISLILYLTIFFGLMSQIALGFIQVMFSLILWIDKRKQKPSGFNHLRFYHITILVYGMAAMIYEELKSNMSLRIDIPLYIVLPMFIATYFVWITYNYNKQLQS